MQKQTYTLIVDYSIRGDLAYLSHQETLKMFQRALIRASVPLSFSLGFNPHPRLSIPFPRSVGTQSLRNRLCATIESSENMPETNWAFRIQDELPAGCNIIEVQSTLGKYMFYPQSVRYVFHMNSPLDPQHLEHLNDCRKQIDQRISVVIQRYWPKKRTYKQVDISSFLKELCIVDDTIEVVCEISQSGTVRVDELMQWLKITPKELTEPICRKNISWSQN